MNEEKQIEKDELFGILSNTINGANFDDLSEAVYKISDVAGFRKQSEGEWLPSPDGIQPIRCSKCNMPAPFVAGENEFGDFEICRYPSKYCHECGAKMKGGAE